MVSFNKRLLSPIGIYSLGEKSCETLSECLWKPYGILNKKSRGRKSTAQLSIGIELV